MKTATTTITITKTKNWCQLKNDYGLRIRLPEEGQLMAMTSAIAFSVVENYRATKEKLNGKSFKLTLTIEEL